MKSKLIVWRPRTLDEAVAQPGGGFDRIERLARERGEDEMLERLAYVRRSIRSGDALGAAAAALDLGWLVAHADLNLKGWDAIARRGQRSAVGSAAGAAERRQWFKHDAWLREIEACAPGEKESKYSEIADREKKKVSGVKRVVTRARKRRGQPGAPGRPKKRS